MCSVRGAGQTNEHVHEGRKELGREKITAGGNKLVQAQLTLRGPAIKIQLDQEIVVDTQSPKQLKFSLCCIQPLVTIIISTSI